MWQSRISAKRPVIGAFVVAALWLIMVCSPAEAGFLKRFKCQFNLTLENAGYVDDVVGTKLSPTQLIEAPNADLAKFLLYRSFREGPSGHFIAHQGDTKYSVDGSVCSEFDEKPDELEATPPSVPSSELAFFYCRAHFDLTFAGNVTERIEHRLCFKSENWRTALFSFLGKFYRSENRFYTYVASKRYEVTDTHCNERSQALDGSHDLHACVV